VNENLKKVLGLEFSGVILIEKEDDVLFEKASGYLDVSNKMNNQIDTKFGLASGAKTFTAVAILSLCEEGKIELNDSINDYMDSKYLYDSNVTIKELLSHTSGIPDYLDEELELDYSNIPWSKLLKPNDYFKFFPIKNMDFKPKKSFKYNNGAFVILAHIIDLVTGDFYQYMASLLKKIGLKNTGYYRFDQLPSNTANGYIIDKDDIRTNIYHLPIIGSGDGGIYSTVYDLSIFWKKLFSYEIIEKETLGLMITHHAFVKDGLHYGYGVWIKQKDDQTIIKMIGQDHGVSFESSYNVKTKVITSVISNNDNDAWKVLRLLEEDCYD